MKTVITLILFLLSYSPSPGQIEEWTLTTSDGRNIARARLQKVGADSLTFTYEYRTQSIPLAKLTHLKDGGNSSSNAQGILVGALVGGSAGYLTGTIIDGVGTKSSQSSNDDLPKILAVSGIFAGGLVGYVLSPSPSGQEYDLRLRSEDEKQAIFESLITHKKFPTYPYSHTRDVIVLKDSSLLKGKIVRPLTDGRNTIVVGENSVIPFEMSNVGRIYQEGTVRLQQESSVQPDSQRQTPSARDESTTKEHRPLFRLHGGFVLPLGNFSESTGGGANPGFALGAE